MARRLDGKVAIITGGSRGIGRATAELFASEGATVFVNYNSSERLALDAVSRINEKGDGHAFAVKADVSKRDEVARMVEEALARLSKVDILVNNAGVLRHGTLNDASDSDLEEMFAVHVEGTTNCSREVARTMVARRYGKIVNLASIAAVGTALPGTTPYSATKAAVASLTRRFAFELGGSGINVNCVAPGFVQSEMTMSGATEKEWDETVKRMSSRAMLARIGQPIDIARAILFLSSDDSSFITGQMLVVDGGRMDYLSHGF